MRAIQFGPVMNDSQQKMDRPDKPGGDDFEEKACLTTRPAYKRELPIARGSHDTAAI
jgi:hypothetical protein